ncbi:MAG TPA: hypothetical protein VMG08_10195 [Allosphingosinicella sp.]|nr:hypothetical protein [Allosphingosinicella sp.]
MTRDEEDQAAFDRKADAVARHVIPGCCAANLFSALALFFVPIAALLLVKS